MKYNCKVFIVGGAIWYYLATSGISLLRAATISSSIEVFTDMVTSNRMMIVNQSQNIPDVVLRRCNKKMNVYKHVWIIHIIQSKTPW